MKIRMRRNLRKKTASIRFSAQTDAEGVALKNAIMATVRGPVDGGLPLRIVQELEKNGVEKADIDLAIVSPKRRTKRKTKE